MLLWAVFATTAFIISIILFGYYRRQVRKTCRQLQFLKEKKTNLRLTSSLPFAELNHLTDEINAVIDQSHKIKLSALRTETELKETITCLSHDIRTPLTSLDGYIQLLRQSTSAEERKHYFNIIQSRISVLNDMLEELFTYAKLQNEAFVLHTETVDFGNCVKESLFSFYNDLQAKGIEPSVTLTEKPLLINGNHEAIARIIQNIIKNAAVHGSKNISFELFSLEKEVVFRCSNDVIHPQEIDISKVFSRFYKSDQARTTNSTGLGLYIAKNLTDRMNGKISAELIKKFFVIELRFSGLIQI